MNKEEETSKITLLEESSTTPNNLPYEFHSNILRELPIIQSFGGEEQISPSALNKDINNNVNLFQEEDRLPTYMEATSSNVSLRER